MLWDNIFEFFVKHIFGGVLSSGSYGGILGIAYNSTSQSSYQITTANFFSFSYLSGSGDRIALPFGNYLSFIATIVSITIIVVLCCLFVKKIVSLVGGLIRQ